MSGVVYRVFVAGLLVLCALIALYEFQNSAFAQTPNPDELVIRLQHKSTVLGPDVRLRDVVGKISWKKSVPSKLLDLKIGEAPPPGESFEIPLRHIMQRIKGSSLRKFASQLSGPKHITVTTAPREIHKALLTGENA